MEKIIKRKLLAESREHLSKKEISLIVGARQVGKTTLMLLLKDELDKRGEKTLFLSLDNEMDRQHFSSQHALIKKINLELGTGGGYVFIDEIQRKENAGIFLKGIYDMRLPYKFIVSGSGSLELKEKIHESLTGRKRLFELNPLSFEEFVAFKTNYHYEYKDGRGLDAFFSIEKLKTESLLNEYLNFGGYPRVVLEESLEEKIKDMNEIYRSYLEKDISYLLRVERVDAFTMLIKLLSSQIGQLVSYSEIGSSVGISIQTLKKYLWYGEKTFVIKLLTPYFKNPRKEIIKSPTVYFYDVGLRNYTVGLFGNVSNPKELGFIFQNFILNILRERLKFKSASVHFWRTKDKAEVDFVIDSAKDVLPVEVKYKKMDNVEIDRSLRSFIDRYNPQNAFVINLNYDKSVIIGRTKVSFLPYWKLYQFAFE